MSSRANVILSHRLLEGVFTDDGKPALTHALSTAHEHLVLSTEHPELGVDENLHLIALLHDVLTPIEYLCAPQCEYPGKTCLPYDDDTRAQIVEDEIVVPSTKVLGELAVLRAPCTVNQLIDEGLDICVIDGIVALTRRPTETYEQYITRVKFEQPWLRTIKRRCVEADLNFTRYVYKRLSESWVPELNRLLWAFETLI